MYDDGGLKKLGGERAYWVVQCCRRD